MRYDPHETLIAPARASANLRFLIAGVVVTVLGCWVLGYLVWFAVYAVLPENLSAAMSASIDDARTPGGVLLSLFFFAVLSMSLAITLRMFHQRRLRSLAGPLPLAILQFRRVLVALILLYAVTAMLPMPDTLTPKSSLSFGRWLGLLPLTVLGILIQTSAEELAFRGYLQSQLAARFGRPLIWIGVPSLCFGMLHFDPSLPTANAFVIVAWASLFGLAAADLTARSGTLGPAIALHFVNNFSAMALAAPEGAFDGMALYTFPFSLASYDALVKWAPVDLMILLCSWLAARLALRR